MIATWKPINELPADVDLADVVYRVDGRPQLVAKGATHFLILPRYKPRKPPTPRRELVALAPDGTECVRPVKTFEASYCVLAQSSRKQFVEWWEHVARTDYNWSRRYADLVEGARRNRLMSPLSPYYNEARDADGSCLHLKELAGATNEAQYTETCVARFVADRLSYINEDQFGTWLDVDWCKTREQAVRAAARHAKEGHYDNPTVVPVFSRLVGPQDRS